MIKQTVLISNCCPVYKNNCIDEILKFSKGLNFFIIKLVNWNITRYNWNCIRVSIYHSVWNVGNMGIEMPATDNLSILIFQDNL